MTDPFRKKDRNIIKRHLIKCHTCKKAKPPAAFTPGQPKTECRKCSKKTKSFISKGELGE